jgi:hypothetical protein
VLKRGGPARQHHEEIPVAKNEPPAAAPPAQPVERAAVEPPASAAPPEPVDYKTADGVEHIDDRPIARQEDSLIRRAADAALEFTDTLPDYVCQETISRMQSESNPANFFPIDLVTTDVVYQNGKEDYRNVAINGKAQKKSMEELGGAWSTGEFGTLLLSLFAPATAAEFHFRNNDRIAGVDARVYGFEVNRENSHWTLHFASQTYLPAYNGRVWIDPRTARVLRIEMEARGLPKDFPSDHIESATDYQYVRLGGTQEFLLPVHAELLSCQRGSSFCSKNTIDFRNYHKFTGQSTVEFGEVK